MSKAAGNSPVTPLEIWNCPREEAVTESGLFSQGSSQAVLSAHQLSPYRSPGRESWQAGTPLYLDTSCSPDVC